MTYPQAFGGLCFFAVMENESARCSPGYETGERSSLGKALLRRRGADEAAALFPQRSKTARISVSPKQLSGTARRIKSFPRSHIEWM